MLEYTGHPLVDVGIATITAFAGKRRPEELTEADLDGIVDYITRKYVQDPLKSFLTVVFQNSGFTQTNPKFTQEQRLEYAKRVLQGYKKDTPLLENTTCVFTGRPAVGVVLKEKEDIPAGRAFRQHIPLLTGENVINFHPYGEAGLPVSGEAMLAIQAFPLGCAKCGGQLLAVHSDNPSIMLDFAKQFIDVNLKAIGLAQQAGSKKMDEPDVSHGTLLIETLLQADDIQQEEKWDKQPFSVTAYHLNNIGQNPKLVIYHLPLEIVGFLCEMEGAGSHRQIWKKIVYRAWGPERQKKRQNLLYEHILGLYDGSFLLTEKATEFFRAYFLQHALNFFRAEQTSPTADYGLTGDIDLVSWNITTSFLRRVFNMKPERIDEIRKMGDQLAEYISKHDDRRLLEDFRHNNYSVFRTSLLRANIRQVKNNNPPIIKFDPYIEVFENAENDYHINWRFTRDLVFLRIIEQLHELEWFNKNTNIDLETNLDEEDGQSE